MHQATLFPIPHILLVSSYNMYNCIRNIMSIEKSHNHNIMSVSEINVGQKRILPIRQRQSAR